MPIGTFLAFIVRHDRSQAIRRNIRGHFIAVRGWAVIAGTDLLDGHKAASIQTVAWVCTGWERYACGATDRIGPV